MNESEASSMQGSAEVQRYRFNFTKYNKLWFSISMIMLIIGAIAFFTKGLNFGIDFKGGTSITVKFKEPVDTGAIEEVLKTVGLEGAVVQRYGESKENMFLIHAGGISLDETQFKTLLADRLAAKAQVNSVRIIGDEKAYITLDKSLPDTELNDILKGFSFQAHPLVSVTRFGSETNHEYLVLMKGVTSQLSDALNAKFGQGNSEILQVEYVGPKVGWGLKVAAMEAVFVALLLIFLYIFMRFDLRFAPGGVICLFHDVLVTIGIFALLGFEFDLNVVAALLTLVGYSINDTIVIYDRIRENMTKFKGIPIRDLVNPSVNQVLSRTVITNITVFAVTAILTIFGGPVIFGFAFAMTFGVVIGTYSTVYIASPITVWIDDHFYQKKQTA